MQIVWTDKADETFDQINAYILKKFTQKEVDDFVLKTYEVLKVIKSHPKLYPLSKIKKYKSTRKAVIHPHSTLYYRISNKTTITLVTFWDNRKNPKKEK
ncbi:type II toxin-antitoxin system RelE/ParE family toxin [Fluviicola taffensis]|uniref:type II toxin-antitoxin system RelE/ParE family toxin n=1 Tax=Fluviicola taffensis TaxID=191579 RepID=UPI003137EDF4